MPTNFPGSLDNFTNPTAADNLNTPAVLHSDQHANENDAIEALEVKVGIDGSLVTGSLDYRVGQLEISGHSPVTLGNANGLSLSGQQLSMGLAGANSTGTLSAQDWNTFNGKQSALTFPLASSLGGTSVSNTGTFTNHSNTIVVGGGTLVLGGFTLTVPATLTAAGLGIANVFTTNQKINANNTSALLVEQDGVKDNVLVVDTANGRVGVNIAPSYLFEVSGQSYIGSSTTSPATYLGSLFVDMTSTPSANTDARHIGLGVTAYKNGANNLGDLVALSAAAYHNGGGNITLQRGFCFIGGNLSTGTTSILRVVDLQAYGTGAGVVDTAVGLNVQNMAVASAGTSVIVKGINVEASSTTITAYKYGINIGNQGGAYEGWGLKIENQSGNTANSFAIETNAGLVVFNQGGNADSDFTWRTDSYDGIFGDASNNSIMLMSNTAGKVGFYGVTAVAQQVLATGAGRTVDDVITFLQTIGLCKQS